MTTLIVAIIWLVVAIILIRRVDKLEDKNRHLERVVVWLIDEHKKSAPTDALHNQAERLVELHERRHHTR